MLQKAVEKVLAVSGGVDSMVMLDMLRRGQPIVAHFNHGTRESAFDDMEFVYKIASDKYHITRVECRVASLGEGASEEAAREERYRFLRSVALSVPVIGKVRLHRPKKSRSPREIEIPMVQVYTAHHLDDLVESIAINLTRGTGWRGLAVLDTPGVRRPFLETELLPKSLRRRKPLAKRDVLRYAAEHEIIFRQDPTNTSDKYLRNRLRVKLQDFKGARKIYKLWQRQKQLKHEIDEIVSYLLPAVGQPWQRTWFRGLDKTVALELLRAGVQRAGSSATRPQLENFRQAILTYAPGKYFNLPGDRLVRFSKHEFYL